jgi:hypothetical protein
VIEDPPAYLARKYFVYSVSSFAGADDSSSVGPAVVVLVETMSGVGV